MHPSDTMATLVSEFDTTMPESLRLLDALKRALRARGLTYGDVAEGLGIAESSVKRLFSSGRVTLDRLEAICRIADVTLAELVEQQDARAPRLRALSRAQEAELVADPRLLLVAVCVLNHIPVEGILARYALGEAELIKRLTVLDRLGLIELMPGNKVRLKVARDFDWLPDGPIAQYVATEVRSDFLDPRHRAGRSEWFVHGLLTADAERQLRERLDALRADFAALHEASRRAPLEARSGQAMLMALAPWEPRAFAALRRPAAGTPA